MEIRPLRSNEVENLMGLWKEFMNDPSAIDVPIPTHEANLSKQKEFVAKLMEEDPSQVLVAADGDKIVGYLLFQSEVKPPLEIAHKVSYVLDLYVRPSHRRQGVARELLRSSLAELGRKGLKDVQLRVWHLNKGAIALYRQFGFKDRMITMQLQMDS